MCLEFVWRKSVQTFRRFVNDNSTLVTKNDNKSPGNFGNDAGTGKKAYKYFTIYTPTFSQKNVNNWMQNA